MKNELFFVLLIKVQIKSYLFIFLRTDSYPVHSLSYLPLYGCAFWGLSRIVMYFQSYCRLLHPGFVMDIVVPLSHHRGHNPFKFTIIIHWLKSVILHEVYTPTNTTNFEQKPSGHTFLDRHLKKITKHSYILALKYHYRLYIKMYGLQSCHIFANSTKLL
jgi:hypothetical protein